jgi:hypothetical protein
MVTERPRRVRSWRAPRGRGAQRARASAFGRAPPVREARGRSRRCCVERALRGSTLRAREDRGAGGRQQYGAPAPCQRRNPGRSPSAKPEDKLVSRLPDICLVVITPDSSEIRWVPAVPRPGVRIHGRFRGAWLVVDEVLQSGAVTYTVFASTASEGLLEQARDLAGVAVERVQESASPATMQPRHHHG